MTTITIDQEVLATLAKLAKLYGEKRGDVDQFVQAGMIAEGLLILAGHPDYTKVSNVVELTTAHPH